MVPAGHCSPVSRPTLPAPRSASHAVTSGVRSCADPPPRWLLPDTDRRIAKETTRPYYADWSSFSMSPDGRFLRTNQPILSARRRRPTVDHSTSFGSCS